MAAGSYGIGKGAAQVFDTSGIAKQVVAQKEKREKFLLDSILSMDYSNLWNADMPSFQKDLTEYRKYISDNHKALSNPTKNMDIWTTKGDMEAKLKLFVATSANDKKKAIEYNDFLTTGTNNSKWELILDDNDVPVLNQYLNREGAYSTPGTNHKTTDFYQRKVDLDTDVTNAVKAALPQIAKKTGNKYDMDNNSWTYTSKETLKREDWIGAIGAKFDLLTDDQDISDSYERKYKKAFEAGTTEATSARDWFIEQAEPLMPKLDVKDIEKPDEPTELSSFFTTYENKYAKVVRRNTKSNIGKIDVPITYEMAEEDWLKISSDKGQLDAMEKIGITDVDTYLTWMENKQSNLNLDRFAKGVYTPTIQKNTTKGNNPYEINTGEGDWVLNISNAKDLGSTTIPTFIDNDGVEHIGETLNIRPVNYSIKDGIIGMNVESTEESSSAEYDQADIKVKELVNNYKDAIDNLTASGWEEGMSIDNLSPRAMRDGFGLSGNANKEAAERALEIVNSFEDKHTELISERDVHQVDFTETGFIPVYDINNSTMLDGQNVVNMSQKDIDRLKKSYGGSSKKGKVPKHDIND